MKIRLFILGFLCVVISFAQNNQETFESYKLDEKRSIQIYTPEEYSEEKVYPLIVVLDADLLFDIVVSNVKFYSYLGEMPEAIVVGVKQKGEQKFKDCDFSDKDGLPKNKGTSFFEFIGQELIMI